MLAVVNVINSVIFIAGALKSIFLTFTKRLIITCTGGASQLRFIVSSSLNKSATIMGAFQSVIAVITGTRIFTRIPEAFQFVFGVTVDILSGIPGAFQLSLAVTIGTRISQITAEAFQLLLATVIKSCKLIVNVSAFHSLLEVETLLINGFNTG